jgi:hypothetical protein
MKRIGLALVLAILVGCGGVNSVDTPAIATTSNMPRPDCEPQNCQGLRIIDGNAEAYRVDALRKK